jgi:hypothetical protein
MLARRPRPRGPLLPRLSHLGTASSTRSRTDLCALDRVTWSAVRRRCWATCRSSTSAVVRIHEHDPEPPDPAAVANHRRMGSTALASAASRVATGQGSPTLEAVNPHVGVRTSTWIYPNLFGPDTACRSVAPSQPGNTAMKSGRTELNLSLGRANEPNSSGQDPASLVGPSPTVTRESACVQPHPRCLPPPVTTQRSHVASERPRFPEAPSTTTPLEPATTRTLTWSVSC